MNVKILPDVLEYLDNLVYILFQKEYFSYLETSQRYIDDLVDDVKINLPIILHKPAPKHFEKYGKDCTTLLSKKVTEQLGTHFLQSTGKMKILFI
jgi:hypothetical protein